MPRHPLLATLGLLLAVLLTSARATTAAPAAPNNSPAIWTDRANDFDVAGVKLFMRRTDCTPTAPARAAQTDYYVDAISRLPLTGGTSRALWQQYTSDGCDNPGALAVNSNIVADAQYLYFTTPSGLLRLSQLANEGDQPELVSATFSGPAELALLGDDLWVLNHAGGVGALWRVNRTTLATQFVLLVNSNARALSAVTAGLGLNARTYVIWLEGSTLLRYNVTQGGSDVIGLNVIHYNAEGNVISCSGLSCSTTSYVFMSTGTQLYRHNNANGQTIVAYDTFDANRTIGPLVADGTHLFLFETYTDPCGDLICNSSTTLRRRTRGSGGGGDALWIADGPIMQIKQHADQLIWRDINNGLWRLPKDADALLPVNLRVTGMRVVQTIYDQNMPVPLIAGKRTFVRVLVRSDGNGVPNVSAVLRRAGDSRTLFPLNRGGRIAVLQNPDRRALEDAFLFELPAEWTSGSTTLTAEINPQRAVYEPTYGDNVASVPISFVPSPVMRLHLFAVSYEWGGRTYTPRAREDVQAIYSWLLRAYPLGGGPGVNLRPTLHTLDGGSVLGAQVTQVAQECRLAFPNPDERSLCAGFFLSARLNAIRATQLVAGDGSAIYYGIIPDGAGFPRGLQMHWRTSVGPVGTPNQNSWDKDTTMGDWYAGHEIAHSLGRAHPSFGSSACGHSASDPSYPYALAAIGPLDASAEGFDAGDAALGIPGALLGDTVWRDVMSYCDYQWVSAYTYNGLYQALLAAQRTAPAAPQLGDWLLLSGLIDPAAPTAFLGDVRALSGAADVPPIEAGGYLIRQRDAAGNLLQDDGFTPIDGADGAPLTFFQVVALAAGARRLEIVRAADGQRLTTRAISAKAPVVDSVALIAPPDPVSGSVTLGWQAQDGDGDPLRFDVHYSADGGATFTPLQLALTATQTTIDADALAGGTAAIFRVEAHDGVHSATADSPPYALAPKPPQVQIFSPADGAQVEYGQLVQFSGAASDLRDQYVAADDLVWYDAAGNPLGTGGLFASDTLRVGANVLTLAATNSAGLTAQASVTVYVNDNVSAPAAPTLYVAPAVVGWHVAAGSSEPQHATLTVGNAGLAALSWTAASDQPWLTLDAAGGSVGSGDDSATLTLIADPAGLAAGQTHRAHVTLDDGTGRAPQVVTVSLSVGQTWPQPAPIVPTALTLVAARATAGVAAGWWAVGLAAGLLWLGGRRAIAARAARRYNRS